MRKFKILDEALAASVLWAAGVILIVSLVYFEILERSASVEMFSYVAYTAAFVLALFFLFGLVKIYEKSEKTSKEDKETLAALRVKGRLYLQGALLQAMTIPLIGAAYIYIRRILPHRQL